MQLHFEEPRIRDIIRRSRDELGDYGHYLAEFYDDLLADTTVYSASTRYNYVVKVRMFPRWLKARGVRPEEVDEGTLRSMLGS